MKKRYLVIMMTAFLLGVAGCGTTEGENANIDASETADEKTYYKLLVEKQYFDMEELKTLVFGELEYDESAVETIKYEDRPDLYSLDIDGKNYKWEFIDGVVTNYWLSIDNEKQGVEIKNEKQARKASDDLVAQLGVAVSDNVVVQELHHLYEGENEYQYALVYENVEIATNSDIDVGDELLYPSSICTIVGGDGVKMLSLTNVVKVTDVLETYSSSEFISRQQLLKAIDTYEDKLWIGMDDVKLTIGEEKIVYVPYVEDNQSILIPAYVVPVAYEIDGEHSEGTYTIDAFTGYVYDWGS